MTEPQPSPLDPQVLFTPDAAKLSDDELRQAWASTLHPENVDDWVIVRNDSDTAGQWQDLQSWWWPAKKRYRRIRQRWARRKCR